MRINKEFKFIFISTPKAGTHTIYDILDKYYSKGLLQAGFHNNQILNGYGSYKRWTVVRNPFTRAVSIWWSACRLAHLDQYKFRKRSGGQYNFSKFVKWLSELPYKDRVKDPLMLNQTEWLHPAQPIEAFHLENLENELIQLPFWKEGIEISHLNTTDEKIEIQSEFEGSKISKPSIKELYNEPEIIESVIKWAKPDFENFEYEEDVLD